MVHVLCTYRAALAPSCSDVGDGGGRVSGSGEMQRSLIIPALFCVSPALPSSSSQHVGGERLLPPGIFPLRQPDRVPPPAHALQRHQRLRESGRRGELR